jgi:hypothetical protein
MKQVEPVLTSKKCHRMVWRSLFNVVFRQHDYLNSPDTTPPANSHVVM